MVLQARETYLDKYKKLEPEIKELDEEVKKFRDDRAEANTPALGSVHVLVFSWLQSTIKLCLRGHYCGSSCSTSTAYVFSCISNLCLFLFLISFLHLYPCSPSSPAPPLPLSVAARRAEKETLKDKRDALDKKIAEAKEDWRKYQDKVDKTNKELVNGNAYDYNKVLLALLVQKYLLYWYKSTNTDAEGAEG